MAKTKDIYQMWVQTNKWPEIEVFLRECARKRVTQKEMCVRLGLDDATFSRLKSKHPEIQKAMDDGKLDLKTDLMGAMYELAMGKKDDITEDTYIEDDGKGGKQKRKVHRIKRNIPPEYKAITYLLNKVFGREFSERFDDLELQEKKMESLKEEWLDESAQDSEKEN